MPTKSVGFQRWRSEDHWPRQIISGSSMAAAMPTRMPAVAQGPKSTTASRMNMKDAPQMAASSRNSCCQCAEALEPGRDMD